MSSKNAVLLNFNKQLLSILTNLYILFIFIFIITIAVTQNKSFIIIEKFKLFKITYYISSFTVNRSVRLLLRLTVYKKIEELLQSFPFCSMYYCLLKTKSLSDLLVTNPFTFIYPFTLSLIVHFNRAYGTPLPINNTSLGLYFFIVSRNII